MDVETLGLRPAAALEGDYLAGRWPISKQHIMFGGIRTHDPEPVCDCGCCDHCEGVA